MLAPIVAFAAATWFSWRRVSVLFFALPLISIGLLTAWAAAHGMLTSKWQTTGPLAAYVAAFCMIAIALTAGALEGRALPRNMGFKPYLMLMLVLVVGIGTLVPALLGYRMTERASKVQSDLSARATHWKHVLDIMDRGVSDRLLGMGLGSFPQALLLGQCRRTERHRGFLARARERQHVRANRGREESAAGAARVGAGAQPGPLDARRQNCRARGLVADSPLPPLRDSSHGVERAVHWRPGHHCFYEWAMESTVSRATPGMSAMDLLGTAAAHAGNQQQARVFADV